jgi:hypothetical protein
LDYLDIVLAADRDELGVFEAKSSSLAGYLFGWVMWVEK